MSLKKVIFKLLIRMRAGARRGYKDEEKQKKRDKAYIGGSAFLHGDEYRDGMFC